MDDSSDWKSRYDDTPLEELPWELGRPKEVVVRLIGGHQIIERELPVLDIGCGAGSNAVYMAAEGLSVVALDFVPKALEYTRKAAEGTGLEIELVNGDASHLPFKNETFGFILDIGCFHSLSEEDRAAYINEISRTLTRGGYFQLTTFSSHNDAPPPCSATAFNDDDIRDLFPHPKFDLVEIEHYEGENNSGNSRFYYTFLLKKV